MADTTSLRLILASASAGRRQLLARTGYPFTVQAADIEEPTCGFTDPQSLVQTVSWLKARAVAATVGDGLVLAADTIGWVDGQPILKPADEADARRILCLLGGRVHELWTGVSLWRRPDDLQLIWQERSLVAFAALSAAQLDAYLVTRSWRGHSGAYAIEEMGDPYVKVLEGSITNVIGLPLESLERNLRWFMSPAIIPAS